MKPKATLKELFNLLEAYAPTWYTEEQQIRVRAALKRAPKSGPRLLNSAPSDPAASSEINQ